MVDHFWPDSRELHERILEVQEMGERAVLLQVSPTKIVRTTANRAISRMAAEDEVQIAWEREMRNRESARYWAYTAEAE